MCWPPGRAASGQRPDPGERPGDAHHGDGSALPFVEAIESAGLEEQNAARNWYVLQEPIWFETKERGTEMLGVPAPGGEFRRLTVMVDYNSPVLGTQHASMYRAEEFKTEYSRPAPSSSCVNWSSSPRLASSKAATSTTPLCWRTAKAPPRNN